MSTEATPGLIRIRGNGTPLLVGNDIHVEAQLGDGTWMPVRGVCSAKLSISPESFVTATVEIEVGAIELNGVTPNVIVWRDRRPWWKRLSALALD